MSSLEISFKKLILVNIAGSLLILYYLRYPIRAYYSY